MKSLPKCLPLLRSQAVSAALDDLDAAEDEELMAAAAAAEGRRRVGRKGSGRGRGKVEEKKAGRDYYDIILLYLSYYITILY